MTKSKCAYCYETQIQENMTRVPRNKNLLAVWCETLGNDFEKKVMEAKSRLFICREHVRHSSKRHSKSRIPYETAEKQGTSTESGNIVYSDDDMFLMDDDFVIVNEEEVSDKDIEYIPEEGEEDEEEAQENNMFEEEEVKPVDYVIVDHSILLKAVLFCRICHSDDVGFDQEVIRGACVSKFSTCFDTLRIPVLSETEHYKNIKKHVNSVVTEKYNKLQKHVLEAVINEAEKLSIAESSKSLEPKSLDVVLERFVKNVENMKRNITVSSLTTDRDPTVGKLMAKKFPKVKQMYDGWHFARNLQKLLWKKQDQVQMKPAKRWIEPLRNHLYWSIEKSAGNGKLAVERFLSFFYHCQNIHDNFKEIGDYRFSSVFRCDHGVLNGSGYFDLTNPQHKKAWQILHEMATEKKRLKDLEHVSPFFSTSQVESFNNVALTYHPKNTFFQEKSFAMRVKLSVIHWNSLKLEERMGIRKVTGKKAHFNKSLKKTTYRNVLTPGTFSWRREILELVRNNIVDSNVDEEEDENEEISIDFFNHFNADTYLWERREDSEFSDEFNDSYDEDNINFS
ncbi:hypothetical protein CRE_04254 [Caenorhabditis remanei]|uniref:THAP-type domain-containing protein n=1 Tax=Caenorhabditis remanei TaxID=31234 RepID=E3N683_CAERE|nr:hypothetical protein CRE_04254 [Caenorhabditis remanei]